MTLLANLEKAIPALEMLIEAHTRVSVKGRMKVTEEQTRNGSVTYRIQSDSLTDLLSPFTRLIFKDIQFYFWGGQVSSDGLRVWFSPKVSYAHVHGGSNGCDVIWEGLWFDIETSQWISREKR